MCHILYLSWAWCGWSFISRWSSSCCWTGTCLIWFISSFSGYRTRFSRATTITIYSLIQHAKSIHFKLHIIYVWRWDNKLQILFLLYLHSTTVAKFTTFSSRVDFSMLRSIWQRCFSFFTFSMIGTNAETISVSECIKNKQSLTS